jgi:predicted TIM-barrel fold metal-dependent hydrolase
VIVDCHTHWGPNWTERYGEDPGPWLAVLDKHAVHKAFLFGNDNLIRLDLCREDNDRLARLAARAPERLIAFGTAWPQTGQAGLEEIRYCVETLGMPALKFHPWLQGFSTADPVFGQMCGLAGELGVPIIFHDGTPCYSLSEQVAGLARRFPRTRFILGHTGLLWAWRSALEAARQPNVWLCLCGPHMRAIEIVCRQADPDRLLWGSDFGFGLTDPVGYRLALLVQAQIPDDLRERILGVNPMRLLDLANS